ncbi:MAG: rRNA maturation RNase YbeY [Candidatus Beckwithbacteria bacterium]|nr:rRNA maturation RNase YbeY [Candidatus Beckwithbacteria bacterium]
MKVVAEVSFVDEVEIKKLNFKYRKINQPTDVLSFPLENMQAGPDKIIRLGDIVICRQQAKKKGHSVAFLIKHAMLHLLGVHHK